MPELSDEELDALVEEATVDAYGDDEQLGGFAVMIEDNLEVPFETKVLGVPVTVQKVTQTESGIVADCVRGGHHQAISVLDLPLPMPPPRGAEWIAAYRHWVWPVREQKGAKMSWVELERIVSEEILRDDGIWRRGGEDPTEPAVPCGSGKVQGVLRYPRVRMSGQVRSVHLTGPSLNTPSRC